MAATLFDEIPEAPALGNFQKENSNRLDINAPSMGLAESQDAFSFGQKKSSTPIGLDIPETSNSLIQEAQGGSLPSFQDVPNSQEASYKTPDNAYQNTGETASSLQKKKGAATGLGLGLQLGSAQTGQEDLMSPDTAIQVLGGIGAGFAVGGPWGAVAGGLAAGVGAFLNTRATKRAKKEQRAKEDRYQKMVKEQLAREEKQHKEERFDKLENQDYNRRAAKMQQQWDAYKDFQNQIMGVLNSNASLKERFAKGGF